jgi:uncharacterized membrane protein YqjE
MDESLPHPPAKQSEPSLAELVRLAINEARDLAKAELALLKVEGKQYALLGAVALIVATAGTVLATLSLCMLAASIVLAAHGSASAALIAAAAVAALVVAIGLTFCTWQLKRQRAASSATPAPTRSAGDAL